MKLSIILMSLLYVMPACASGSDSTITVDQVAETVALGNRIVAEKGNITGLDSLLESVPEITLDCDAVDSLLKSPKEAVAIVDAIYLVSNMKKGMSLDESRDGLSITMAFPYRSPNDNDFRKLRDIMLSSNNMLKMVYLGKIPQILRNNGLMKGLKPIIPLIKEHVDDCKEKTDIINLLGAYAIIADGEPAPDAVWFDESGNSCRLSDLKGKVVVIDVWATWCHNCLKKAPAYHELKKLYSDDDRVRFLTVSIDRIDDTELWKSVSRKHHMDGSDNMIVNTENSSDFENTYLIKGVPRYIVIDDQGYIASSFAPSPGEELKKIIDSALKNI